MKEIVCKILLVSLMILSIAFTQSCFSPLRVSSASAIQQLQTGHFEIIPASPVSRFNKYNVTFRQSGYVLSNLNVALSIIFLQNYYDKTGVDFIIRTQSLTATSFLALLIISTDTKWTKAHIHYVASSRDQFKCASIMVDDRSLLQANSKVKSISVPKLVSSTQELSVFPSISGIKIQETNFDIKIGNAKVSGKQNKIQIPIQVKNKNPFEILYISYFVYINTRRVIVSPPSVTDSNSFLTQIIQNKNQYNSVGGMTGISDLTTLLSKNQPKRRLLATQTQMLIYQSAFTITDFGKIVNNQNIGAVGLQLAGQIVDVQNSIISKISKNFCLSYEQCIDAKGTITQFKNSSYGCILCPTNKYYDSQLQKCVCVQGYIPFSEEECLSVKEYCGPDTVYQNGTCYQATKRPQDICQLRQNFKIDPKTNNCICQDGFILVKIPGGTTNCVKCPPQAVFSVTTLRCQCANGLILIGDICSPRCGTNQQYNSSSNKCECTPNSYRNILDRCVVCGSNAKFNSNKGLCECISGYFGTGTVCRKIQQIKSNIQILNINKITT